MSTTQRTRDSRARDTLVARSRLNNLYWERRLGIATRGVVPVARLDSCHYATMSYALLWRVLDHLALGPSDVFIDIGCGKGRVLCGAARYPVKQVVGVDLSEPLCEEARENARRMRGRRAPISVETTLADEFDYSAATVLFLYAPFGRATLEPLLEKVGRERRESLRIAHVSASVDDVYQRQGWLEQTAHWGAAGVEHSVSFYRSH
jgi:SAM-dependent methyltransferase